MTTKNNNILSIYDQLLIANGKQAYYCSVHCLLALLRTECQSLQYKLDFKTLQKFAGGPSFSKDHSIALATLIATSFPVC